MISEIPNVIPEITNGISEVTNGISKVTNDTSGKNVILRIWFRLAWPANGHISSRPGREGLTPSIIWCFESGNSKNFATKKEKKEEDARSSQDKTSENAAGEALKIPVFIARDIFPISTHKCTIPV